MQVWRAAEWRRLVTAVKIHCQPKQRPFCSIWIAFLIKKNPVVYIRTEFMMACSLSRAADSSNGSTTPKLQLITYLSPDFQLELFQTYQHYLEDILSCESHLIAESRWSAPPVGKIDPFTANEVDIGIKSSLRCLSDRRKRNSIILNWLYAHWSFTFCCVGYEGWFRNFRSCCRRHCVVVLLLLSDIIIIPLTTADPFNYYWVALRFKQYCINFSSVLTATFR